METLYRKPSPDEAKRTTGTLQNARLRSIDVDLESLPGPTLARLIDEVRNDQPVGRAYNRTYNRHNR